MNTDGSQDDQPTIPPSSKEGDAPTIAPGLNANAENSNQSQLLEFGDYRVIEEIARGGMGVVYRAHQKSLNREVAVKMILAGQFASREHVERFKTEAEAAAKLDHAAIVPIYEIDEFQGHHYFSMKLIEGGDLGERLSQLRQNHLPALIKVLEEVTQAVHHAHKRGILHRDLKPANILIDNTGQPYVTDLGLARSVDSASGSTRTGEVMGTPSYMSPEQASGSPDITTATDVYSLGAILYEILTGRPPFQGGSAMETIMQVVSDMPEKPSSVCAADRELESICMKCLAKEPGERYSSASELAADLQRWLDGEPVSVRAQSVLSTTRFWMRQNFGRAAWALFVGPVFGIISSLCFWYATIQERVNQSLSTFDKFESVERPFTLLQGLLLQLASIPMLLVFAFSILFIGFVTAVFVKPKNSGADLAAGAVVGFFASLAAFVFCFAAMNVLTSVNTVDLRNISALAAAPAGTTPTAIAELYPELATMPREEQISLLAQKVEADYFFQVPKGIWLGLVMAIAFYFVPCVFEIWAAGPLLRIHRTWYFALLPYLEAAFPVVVATTLGGVVVATWLLFGASGVLIGLRVALIVALVACACYIRIKSWPVVARAVVNLFLVLFFVGFLFYDFQRIPAILHFRTSIRHAERMAEREGADVDMELRLASTKAEFAKYLASNWQGDRAERLLEKAEQRLENRIGNQAETEGADKRKLVERQRDLKIERVLLLEDRGKDELALKLITKLGAQFPSGSRIQKIRDRLENVDDDKTNGKEIGNDKNEGDGN